MCVKKVRCGLRWRNIVPDPYRQKVWNPNASVADPRCLSRIPHPNFSIPVQGSKRFWIPDPNQRIFSPKNCCQALGNIICDVHPGSGFFFHPGSGSRIQGSKKHCIPNPELQHSPTLRSCSCLRLSSHYFEEFHVLENKSVFFS